jgi:hypothetical protein
MVGLGVMELIILGVLFLGFLGVVAAIVSVVLLNRKR